MARLPPAPWLPCCTQSHVGCNWPSLRRYLKNYGTNLLLSADSPYTVIEAEFDRSFHWLSPWMSVLRCHRPRLPGYIRHQKPISKASATTPRAFQPGGALILHWGLEIQADVQPGVTTYLIAQRRRLPCRKYPHRQTVKSSSTLWHRHPHQRYPVGGIRSGQHRERRAAMALAHLKGCHR